MSKTKSLSLTLGSFRKSKTWKVGVPNPKDPNGFWFGITSRFLIYSCAVFIPLVFAVVVGVLLALLPDKSVENMRPGVIPVMGTLIVLGLLVAEYLRAVAYDNELPSIPGSREIHFPPDALPKAHLTPPSDQKFADSAKSIAGSATKRVFDVAFAYSSILFLAPLMGVISASLKIAGRPKIFDTEVRIGLHGKRIKLLRFRVNYRNPDPLDQFLAATALDTIPALFAIARGDMSVVGPMPLSASNDRSNFELPIKPGMFWSREFESMEFLENYAARWSIGLDIFLLAKVIPEVLAADFVSFWKDRSE